MIDINGIDFENSIDIKVLENISLQVHKSSYLQSQLDKALFNDVNYKEKYPIVEFSKTENRWNSEVGALYGAINETSYVVGGTFNPNGLDFNSSIDIKVLANISENIHESTYLQSKFDESLFTNDVYKSNEESKSIYPFVKYSETTNQWNEEIKALYDVIATSTYVDSNGMFNPASLNITGVVNVSILSNLKSNIHKSTYLQSKLENTLEDLVTTDPSSEVYLLDRDDIGEDYNLEFNTLTNTYEFNLIDTGGIEPESEDIIISQMREQAQMAIEMADVVIFLTDVKQGITAADTEIALMLKKSKKKIILVCNKADNFRSST